MGYWIAGGSFLFAGGVAWRFAKAMGALYVDETEDKLSAVVKMKGEIRERQRRSRTYS